MCVTERNPHTASINATHPSAPSEARFSFAEQSMSEAELDAAMSAVDNVPDDMAAILAAGARVNVALQEHLAANPQLNGQERTRIMLRVGGVQGLLSAHRIRIDPEYAQEVEFRQAMSCILNAPEKVTTEVMHAASIRATVSQHEDAAAALRELYKRMSVSELWKMLQTAQRGGVEEDSDDEWGEDFWAVFLEHLPNDFDSTYMDDLQRHVRDVLERDLRPERRTRSSLFGRDVVVEPTEREHRRAMDVAAEYLTKYAPHGLQEYLEAEATGEGGYYNEHYNPDMQDFVALKKLLTTARAAHHAKIMEAHDQATARRQEERRQKGLPLELPERPAEHLCPLSHDVMLDPVIAADGVSYERGCIEDWLLLGKVTSPSTRKELSHTELVDNINLRTLIRDYDEVEHKKLLALADALGRA